MDLIQLLPEDYRQSDHVVQLQKTLGTAEKALSVAITELEEQLFVDTATWGLIYWEGVYGTRGERAKELSLRRAEVRAKMRGAGTTTVELIKNVSESFVNGEVDVVEKNNEYRFLIYMVSVIGIPPNMEDLKAAIEEIKPAHLDFEIIIKYNTWGMVQEKKYTWATAKGRKWKEMKEVAL